MPCKVGRWPNITGDVSLLSNDPSPKLSAGVSGVVKTSRVLGSDSPSVVVSCSLFAARLARLEGWVWSDGFSELKLGELPLDAGLAREVAALSDLYTTARPALARDRDGANTAWRLRAKVGFFLCSDAPKVFRVLQESERRGAWARPAAGGWLRVLDLGCGVGTGSVGLILSLNPAAIRRVVLHGVDSDRSALPVWTRIARQAAAIAGLEIRLSHEARNLESGLGTWSPADCDLVLIHSVLNELFIKLGPSARLARCAAWLGQTLAGGLTIAIEPALRAPTRTLHQIRDLLLAEGQASVWAPCPHQQLCPMLARERDWCHERTVFPQPPRVVALQSLTKRRDEHLNFSFVVLSRRGRAPAPPSLPAGAGRLVSDALRSKGKTERLLCAGDGVLHRLRLLDREQTDANALLPRAARGELIRCSDLSSPRIPAGTRIEKLVDEMGD